jgi:hypothetical protein
MRMPKWRTYTILGKVTISIFSMWLITLPRVYTFGNTERINMDMGYMSISIKIA